MPQRFFIDERTVLRPLSEQDSARLYAAVDANRDHLRRFMAWLDTTRSAADIEAFRARAVEQETDGNGLSRIIERDAQICGVVSLDRIDQWNRRGELGYWITRDLEGRGVCRRACARMIEYAFDELQLNRLTIAAAVDNRRSRALAERLGFTLEGIQRESEWLYDHYVDHAVYGLLRREWHRPVRS